MATSTLSNRSSTVCPIPARQSDTPLKMRFGFAGPQGPELGDAQARRRRAHHDHGPGDWDPAPQEPRRCLRIDGGRRRGQSIPPPVRARPGSADSAGDSRQDLARDQFTRRPAHHPAARSGPAGSPRGHSATAAPRTQTPNRRRSGREAPPDPARPAERRPRTGRVRRLTGCR